MMELAARLQFMMKAAAVIWRYGPLSRAFNFTQVIFLTEASRGGMGKKLSSMLHCAWKPNISQIHQISRVFQAPYCNLVKPITKPRSISFLLKNKEELIGIGCQPN